MTNKDTGEGIAGDIVPFAKECKQVDSSLTSYAPLYPSTVNVQELQFFIFDQ